MALLAISTGPPSSPTHHILPFSALSSLAVLSLPSTSATSRNIGPLDTTALLDRANTAVATAKEKAAKVNKGVGREIQEIFDALDKQFSARWKEKDIIVMERVVLRGPGYRVEDCKVITKDGEGLLGRVKKVVSQGLLTSRPSRSARLLIGLGVASSKMSESARYRGKAVSR